MKPRYCTLSVLFILLGLLSCQSGATQGRSDMKAMKETQALYDQLSADSSLREAVFASGCFWCVEAIYQSVIGVKDAISGYSGGHTDHPTYEGSNTGRTGHAEAVSVFYDPELVDFRTLVEVYFGSQDVTQVNGQGPDKGSQYRSIVFYQDQEEKEIIEGKIEELNLGLSPKKVAAEVLPFERFWVAEDYHQEYERLHPDNPYVRRVSKPRLMRFQKQFPHLVKEH